MPLHSANPPAEEQSTDLRVSVQKKEGEKEKEMKEWQIGGQEEKKGKGKINKKRHCRGK